MDERSSVRVTLLRHGESEANRLGRWQGQGDSPLSSLGRAQAERAGARLSRQRFDRVIASDLQRASDTARATGHAFEPDAEFRELDVGAWEGMTREEVSAAFPDELARLARGEDVPLGGGESYAVFVSRVERALARVCGEMAAGEHVLVVCHGGVIGALASIALGIRERGHWPISRVGNTALSELRVFPDAMQLAAFNDDLHLDGMPGSEPDLPVARHELLVSARSGLPESVLARLTEAAAYRLGHAEANDLPEAVRPFETEAAGAQALEQWLSYAAESYAGGVARCLVQAEHVDAWIRGSLGLEVGEGAGVAPAREGAWARLRGGERPVLQRYNADAHW